MTLKRIIHIADIHVRLFKRHKEYSECFEQFYSDLEAAKIDYDTSVIVIAGDVVHSKTELSPEMVELVSDLFITLTKYAPVIVIAGNHDMNLANKDRLDALSPIIANLKGNYPQIHYFKDSGVYPFEDVDFCVHSIVGEQSDWPTPQKNGRQQIALFHGPIHNAKTDVGYTVTNRHVMIESFDGYDMVLLGDIHRHQTLQEHDALTGKPIIVYCGSLLQQNHGESLNGHGWCDWDVETCSFTFHELHNRYGYYTLRIENGVVPNYDDMPENARLRIFAGDMDQSEIKKLVANIRSKHKVTELSVSNFDGAKKSTSLTSVGNILDVADVQFQNKLIVDYLKQAMPELTDDTLDAVIKLNKATNDSVSTDDLARRLTWRPISLKFDNLFTYGEGNSIDFTNLNGVLGIFAPNASGKTSVAEAICFALYDKTPRTNRAANIMNTRKTSCSLEFIFEIDGIEYNIVRTGTKNKKGEVKIDVNFSKLENGVVTSLNGEERRYTDQNIAKIVGEYEDFILTTFSSSAQAGLFVDRGQSDRKDLLSQFMGLNIFDKLHTEANDESKEIQGQLKQFKKDDFTQELVDVQAFIGTETILLNTVKGMAERSQEEIQQYDVEIKELYEQKLPVNEKLNLEDLVKKCSSIEQNILALENKRSDLRAEQLTKTVKLEEGRNKLQELKPVIELEEWNKVSSESYALETQLTTDKRLLDSYNFQLKEFESFTFNKSCEVCTANAQTTLQKIGSISSKLPEIQVKIDRNKARQAELASWLSQFTGLQDQHNKWTTGKAWVATTEVNLQKLQNELDGIENQIIERQNRFTEQKKAIDIYYASQEAIETNKRLNNQIQGLEAVKTGRQTMLKDHLAKAQQHSSKLAVLNSKKEGMLARIEEAKALEAKYEAYRAYLAAVCRDGLPYKLIADVLPSLEAAVNNLLSQMVEFTLAFETDGKNVNMKIMYDQDRIWPLELASGMEKFISGLAIRVALTTISSLPKSNFLLIDEGFGTLDSDNLSNISLAFAIIRSMFDFVLVISHVEEMRNIVDSSLEIERKDGFSKIVK